MNPLSINPLALLIGAGTAVAIGFSAGWQVNGWRLGAEIAGVQAELANKRADQAAAALKDLAAAAKVIKDQADGAQVDISAVNTELAAIRREFKNGKAAPLPVDCKPDAPRVRSLTRSAAAIDQAIARQRAGSDVQADRSTKE